MRPWRRGMRSGRRPASAFSTRRTGSGRLRGTFHAACASRGHFSRNALPIAKRSARDGWGIKAEFKPSMRSWDSDDSSIAVCVIAIFPSSLPRQPETVMLRHSPNRLVQFGQHCLSQISALFHVR